MLLVKDTHPALRSLAGVFADDNAIPRREVDNMMLPQTFSMEFLATCAEQANELSDEEKETMACGEHSEREALIARKKLTELEGFMGALDQRFLQ